MGAVGVGMPEKTTTTMMEALQTAWESFSRLSATINHVDMLTPNDPGYPVDSLLHAVDEYMGGNGYRLLDGKDPADIFRSVVTARRQLTEECVVVSKRLREVRRAMPADVSDASESDADRVRALAADRDRLAARVSELESKLARRSDNLADDAPEAVIMSSDTVEMLARAIDQRCQRLIDKAMASMGSSDT